MYASNIKSRYINTNIGVNDLIRYFFFFKQKTAYEMRISDWSSDVCSSDLQLTITLDPHAIAPVDLDSRIRALAAVPFAVDQEPPVRLHLLHTATDEHVLVLVVHHIAADGRSEERRVGKGVVSTCRSRLAPYP